MVPIEYVRVISLAPCKSCCLLMCIYIVLYSVYSEILNSKCVTFCKHIYHTFNKLFIFIIDLTQLIIFLLQKSVIEANDLYINNKETDCGCYFDDFVNDSCLYYPSHFGHKPGFEWICNSLFTRNVSFNSSAVHIPKDIHENGKVALYQCTVYIHVLLCIIDTKVLCFVWWSCGLDDHFKNQSEDVLRSLGITYQYFGSRDGVLRYYPGEYSNCKYMHDSSQMNVTLSLRRKQTFVRKLDSYNKNVFKPAHSVPLCPCM